MTEEKKDRREFLVMAAAVAERARGKQHQRRAQALAAGADDVLGDLADQHHVGMQAVTNDGVHRLHVGGDRRVKGGEAQGVNTGANCVNAAW